MAFDDREERASVVSLTQSAPPTVTPNATPDSEWRAQSGWGNSANPVTAVGGQPVMHRMQGVPTMPGYRDRPGKWNMLLPPLLALWLLELLRRLFDS